ncbi:hypothetical protein BKP64_16430 [Marinobacter salinus]|uniref:Diguanylate phosphodiesterase n=1 Tax=Marinobacter salinus TaxID=1874317 RepID=A0A1D9GQF2_9GAMM|nr:EAL domain-containing protein [Marinobacter salinus]AOY89630.1 hypothetical protein BKP64_16430 [Marinobacter salinus]
MKIYNHLFESDDSLTAFITERALSSMNGLLQVFSGDLDEGRLSRLLASLPRLVPGFRVIGASTNGEICEGQDLQNEVLLSFSAFDDTRVELVYSPESSYLAGQQLGEAYHETDVRLAIAFGNGLVANPEEFIKGFTGSAPDICLAGGNAGDNNRFERTFVIIDGHIHYSGMVLALLRSDVLQVHNSYVLDWAPIGIQMEVTRATGNVLYELNHKPVTEVYKYYLGDEVARDIPLTLMEFPLIKMAGKQLIARSPVGEAEDGGLIFAGSFEEGELVQFGVADVGTITNSVKRTLEAFSGRHPIEGVYTYSCTARRSFLQSVIKAEVGAISTMGPNAGFFTYGEYFYSAQASHLLNITTTLVTLSEHNEVQRNVASNQEITIPQVSTLRSLTHLAQTTARELNLSMQFLEQYKHALDKTAIVTKTDVGGKITYVNRLFESISGYSAEEVIGKSHSMLRHPDMPSRVFRDLWQTILKKKVWQGTIKNRKKNGGYYYVDTTIVPIIDQNGDILEFISIRNNITDIILNQELLTQQRTDKLTGLRSRARLIEDLTNKQPSQLALMDVRNFKSFNDYYGITIGDRILIELAAELERCCHDQGIIVYRLYGANFALMPVSDIEFSEFKIILEGLARELQANPISVNNEHFDIEFFFGVGRGSKNLLTFAETALQRVKQENTPNSVFELSEQDFDHTENFYWLNEIKEALRDGRMVSHYQPIVSVSGDSGSAKHESLLRMIGRDGEVISPFRFLGLAKKSKYYPEITRKVVADAFSLASSRNFTVSVNLSAEDIENTSTSEFILGQLAEHGGSNLIFEITETESIQDYSRVKRFVESIRSFNAQIAIDDFGSGYSNFSYLIELQPEYVKIDGSIISRILSDEKSRLITESIVDIAHKIGSKVIAEFVSSEDIAQVLRAINVDYFQGFHFGKPGPLAYQER